MTVFVVMANWHESVWIHKVYLSELDADAEAQKNPTDCQWCDGIPYFAGTDFYIEVHDVQ